MTDKDPTGAPPVSPVVVLTVGIAAISTGAIFVRLADAPALVTAAYRVGLASVLLLPAAGAIEPPWPGPFVENERILMLRNRLYDGLRDMEEVYVNGDMEHRIAGNLNISFNFVEGESLMMALKDMAVSSGSACTSASLEPSYVLRALGVGDDLAHSSIRFSVGRFTTEAEVDEATDVVIKTVRRLRDMSPLYEMAQEGIDISSVNWNAH